MGHVKKMEFGNKTNYTRPRPTQDEPTIGKYVKPTRKEKTIILRPLILAWG